MSIKSLLTKIQKNYDDNITALKRLRKEQAALKKAGINYGTPSYKKKRYLRIVKPAIDGQPRQFVYVGADEDKQQAALDALSRGQEYDQITEQINQIERNQAIIEGALGAIVDDQGWSQDPARRHMFL